MKKLFLGFLLFLITVSVFSQSQRVSISNDTDGLRLKVDGENLMINGMNWDYVPIGTNYSYNFWGQSDSFIKAALDSEMLLLKNMGVNTIEYTLVCSQNG